MSVADKLISIFVLFSGEKAEWSVEEAASHLGLSVSTAYRHFKTLSDAGLITAFAAGKYVLGPAIIQLDRHTRLNDPLIRAVAPLMKRLAAEITVPGVLLLCRFYRRQVICVHQEAINTSSFVISYERGRLMQLHRGAASKIILAHMPARVVRAYQQENIEDIETVGLGRDWTALKRNLRILRNARLCITHAELDAGATGIAVPLFASNDMVIGSLGLVIEEKDYNDGLRSVVSEQMQLAAECVNANLRQIVSES